MTKGDWHVAWLCHGCGGLALIRWRRVFMVWHCWLALHSSLHGVQSEHSQHDCCLFIHRAGNGRVQAARTKTQTLEHSSTLCCCRGSQSTPCSYWHRHIQALRSIKLHCRRSTIIIIVIVSHFLLLLKLTWSLRNFSIKKPNSGWWNNTSLIQNGQMCKMCCKHTVALMSTDLEKEEQGSRKWHQKYIYYSNMNQH